MLSHDVLAPGMSVQLNPLSAVLPSGQMCNPAKSAVRALHVLEFLASSDKPLRAVDIACALGFSPSSAHQLLQTMVDATYLILDPISKRYYPSPRIAKLGGGDANTCLVYGAVGALMNAVHRELGVCASITTCQGSLSASRGAFIQVIDNVGDDRCDERNGYRAPLFGTTAGAMWLASQSDDVVRAAIRLCRRELGERAKETGKLLDAVRRVRAQGHAFGGVTDDGRNRTLAVALPPCRNGIVLVICVFGETEEMQSRRDDMAVRLKQLVHTFMPSGPAR